MTKRWKWIRKNISIMMILCLLSGAIPNKALAKTEDYNGISIPINQFVTNYTGKESPKVSSLVGKEWVSNELIDINNASFDNDTKNASLSVKIDSRDLTFDIKGALYNSYKQNKGINSLLMLCLDPRLFNIKPYPAETAVITVI